MDVFAHAAWTYILFHNAENFYLYLLAGILPDILSWGFYALYHIPKKGLRPGPPKEKDIPRWVFTLYGLTHSLFSFACVFIILMFITDEIPVYLTAWLVHLMIDIPTHSREYLHTPFLWPFSDYAFPGISWGTVPFMVINWVVIIITIFLIRIYGF